MGRPAKYSPELRRRAIAEAARRPWRTRSSAELATIEWIDWYNTARLHGEIGHIPPHEHEANWRAAHTPATMAITQAP